MHIYIYMYIYIYTYIYIYVYIYIHISVYVSVSVSVYTYIYIYIHKVILLVYPLAPFPCYLMALRPTAFNITNELCLSLLVYHAWGTIVSDTDNAFNYWLCDYVCKHASIMTVYHTCFQCLCLLLIETAQAGRFKLLVETAQADLLKVIALMVLSAGVSQQRMRCTTIFMALFTAIQLSLSVDLCKDN